jgi:hypothetical protein
MSDYRAIGILMAAALAGSAHAQRSRRIFKVHQILDQQPKSVDRMLGRPLSVGEGGLFREYAAPNSGVYVSFRKGKANLVVVTFRIPFDRPAEALASVGVDVAKKKPTRSSIGEMQWRNVDGIPFIQVRSSDGRLWNMVELGRVEG